MFKLKLYEFYAFQELYWESLSLVYASFFWGDFYFGNIRRCTIRRTRRVLRSERTGLGDLITNAKSSSVHQPMWTQRYSSYRKYKYKSIDYRARRYCVPCIISSILIYKCQVISGHILQRIT